MRRFRAGRGKRSTTGRPDSREWERGSLREDEASEPERCPLPGGHRPRAFSPQGRDMTRQVVQ